MKKLKVFDIPNVDPILTVCWMAKLDTGDYSQFKSKTK